MAAWRERAKANEQRQSSGQAIRLEARFEVGNPVYAVDPQKGKLDPQLLGSFQVTKVHKNNTYTIKDVLSNAKKLHHD